MLLISLIFVSCDDDDDSVSQTPPGSDTFEIIAESPDHETLEQALLDTGLDQVLNDGFYTVFAPTDDAFSGVDLDELNNDQLTNVLLNHVIVGENFFEAPGISQQSTFSTGYFDTAATGVDDNNLDLYINIGDNIVLNGASTVISSDLNANNGVVHVVDEVIPMPDITTFVIADPSLQDLEAALTRNDQPDFLGTLSTPNGTDPAPFTVFAPRDDRTAEDPEDYIIRFDNLLEELGLQELADIPQNTLTQTLNSHVIPNKNKTSVNLENEQDQLGEDELITVQTLGDDLSIDASNLNSVKITDPNGREIDITLTDIQTTNGVIHAIDKVILPQQ